MKKKKPAFMKVRLPVIKKTGGYHKPRKGRGSYNRQREKLAVRTGD